MIANLPGSTKAETSKAGVFLEQYANTWYETTMKDCKGRELSCLQALIRMTDVHALRLTRLLPKVDSAVSYRICRGGAFLIPELLRLIDQTVAFRATDTSDELASWAARKLEQAGALGSARRMAAVEPYGLCTFEFLKDNEIAIVHGSGVDLEEQENLDRNKVNDWDKEQASRKWRAAERAWATHSAKSRPSIAEFEDGKFIVLPRSDGHFQAGRTLIELNALEYAESESFPDHVRLGPLNFGQWKEVATGIAALLLINAAYLLQIAAGYKLQHLDLINLSGRFLHEDRTRSLIQICCPAVEAEAVDEVLEIFASDEEDATRFEKSFGPPTSMLVRVPGGYLVSQSGRAENPYWYMTEKLKTRYNKEWRIAAADVSLREASFREQLHSLLSGPGYVIGKANLKLKRADGSQGTDIDATIFERETNTIYLFQLKWPDVAALEWRPRESQFTTLRDDGLKWIEEVTNWLERSKEILRVDVLCRLELHKVVRPDPPVQFKLLMVTQSWTRLSGKAAYDTRAAWTSWTRLRKLIIERRYSLSPLSGAWPELYSPKEPCASRNTGNSISTIHFPDLVLNFKA